MISRIWHGYTIPENADAYEDLLRDEIFTWIAGKAIPGYQGIQLYRRPLDDEVEFITIMWFDNLEAVRQFAGEDYETAVVLPQARALLSHFDAHSQHYTVCVDRMGNLKAEKETENGDRALPQAAHLKPAPFQNHLAPERLPLSRRA